MGHLGCMDQGCTPKQLLFGELLRMRPFYVVKKRWHGEVAGDLRAIGIGDGWGWLCQDCKLWSELCSSVIDILAQNKGTITCAANIFSNL